MLINVGGYKLHLRCMGEGDPTVILEAGAGGFTSTWSLVQPEVAGFTHVCSYDRAGHAWSDSPPDGLPRTVKQLSTELRILLIQAKIKPPYILVGHSLGGFIVRLYAARYPDDVAGMVLVDPSHEDEWTGRFPPEHRRGLWMMDKSIRALAELSRTGIPQFILRHRLPAEIRKLPPEAQEEVRTMGYRPETLRVIHREFTALEESAAQLRELAGTLGNLPLLVLRHGQPGPVAHGVSRETADRIEQAFAEAYAKLAALSTRGRLITALQSGREIHIDQPELVTEAIKMVVDMVRAERKTPVEER
ncbi:MAG: alpha/beta fold hydrolase [Candidatus Latescibacterota bacterium]